MLEHFQDVSAEDFSKLIDFYFLTNKMVLIYENFEVQEINIADKTMKTYNLQEIENFEISEEVEEDKVIAFALEKDVQLLGVACVDTVHIFQYNEEEEISLEHLTQIAQQGIVNLLVVESQIIMV